MRSLLFIGCWILILFLLGYAFAIAFSS